LPVLVVAIIGSALGALMPTAVGIVIELGLQALIFYWFLMTTRMALGVSWPISAVLLIVYWVPSVFLSLLVTRYLGVVPVTGG
jgi:hypothetical protein